MWWLQIRNGETLLAVQCPRGDVKLSPWTMSTQYAISELHLTGADDRRIKWEVRRPHVAQLVGAEPHRDVASTFCNQNMVLTLVIA